MARQWHPSFNRLPPVLTTVMPVFEDLPSQPSSSTSSSTSPSGHNLSPFPQNVHPQSINGLLRQNCGERLYVPPLLWTSRQLDLLDCQFVNNQDIALAVAIEKFTENSVADSATGEQKNDEHGAANDAVNPLEVGSHSSSPDSPSYAEAEAMARIEVSFFQIRTSGPAQDRRFHMRAFLGHHGLSPIE